MTKQWPAVLSHQLPQRAPLLPTALMHMRKPAMGLRMTELVLHQRQSRLLGQKGLHAGGKHPGGSPLQPLWLAEGRGQRAGRAQAGVEAELRLLLPEQLSSHLGGQLLEALLASGVDPHRDRLDRVSMARPCSLAEIESSLSVVVAFMVVFA